MKILYLSVGAGGSDTALLNMLDGLSDSPVEPFVVVHRRSGLIPALRARRIPCLVLKYKPAVWPRTRSLADKLSLPWRLLRQFLTNRMATVKLARYVKTEGIGLIHSNTGIIHVGFHAARQCGIPHVWHLREYQDLDMRLAPFPSKRHFIRKLGHPGTYNVAITDGIFAHFELDPANACRLYDGVRPRQTTPPRVKKENYFLFAGSIAPHKGVAELIDAFIEFSRNDRSFELRIAGSIPGNHYFRSLARKVREHGMEERISFLGHRDPVDPLMARAAALVVPSRSEAFGLITAEAMFNGCLVIGKNRAGTKEQFDNGLSLSGSEIGLRYSTVADLARCMKQVKEAGIGHDQQLLGKAWRTVSKLYSIEEHAARMRQIYTPLLSTSH